MAVGASSGISLDGVILSLFLLALTAIGVLVMVYGSNIRKDISKIFDKMDEHSQEDKESFQRTDKRIGLIAQRLTKLDKRTEEV